MTLRKENIDHLRFWLLNEDDREGISLTVALVYENGVEFPVVQLGGVVFSADPGYSQDGYEPIYPSDDFYEVLAAAVLHLQAGNPRFTWNSAVKPGTFPDHERVLIDNVLKTLCENNVPFEFEWLIETAFNEADIEATA